MVNKRKLGQNQLASLPNSGDRNDYGAVGDVLQAPVGQQYGSLNQGYRNDLQSGGSNNYSKANSKSYNANKMHLGGSIGLPNNANSLPSQYQR